MSSKTIEFRKPCRAPRGNGYYYGKIKGLYSAHIIPFLVINYHGYIFVSVLEKEMPLKDFIWYGSVPECREISSGKSET